jgi:hypothetical protein
MQKGTAAVFKGLGFLVLLYLCGYLLWGFLDVAVTPHSVSESELKPDNVTHGSVVLLTALTSNKLDVFRTIDDFYGKVWSNRQQYARLHGISGSSPLTVDYEAMVLDLNDFPLAKEKHAVWGKLPSIMHAFERYPSAEWVWWLDIDALIMTPTIDLYDHLLNPEVLKTRLLDGQPLIGDPRILGENFTDLRTGEVAPVSPC